MADGIDGQEWIFLTLRWLIDHRWVSLPRAARFMEWMERLLPTPEQSDFLEPDRLPPLYGLAVGTKDGRPASAAVAMMHIGDIGMGFATGVPLACGLELLAKGELAQPGVGAPEGGAIEPRRFFEIFGTKGSQPLADGAPSLLVSRSWDPNVRENLGRALSAARAQIAASD